MKFALTLPHAKAPERHGAGFDLCYNGLVDLKLHQPTRMLSYLYPHDLRMSPDLLIDTGIAVDVPPGYVLLVAPRSSTGRERGLRLVNTIGVIDPGYRDSIKLAVAFESGSIKLGERIAQAILVPAAFALEQVDSLTPERGGFGSTGK